MIVWPLFLHLVYSLLGGSVLETHKTVSDTDGTNNSFIYNTHMTTQDQIDILNWLADNNISLAELAKMSEDTLQQLLYTLHEELSAS